MTNESERAAFEKPSADNVRLYANMLRNNSGDKKSFDNETAEMLEHYAQLIAKQAEAEAVGDGLDAAMLAWSGYYCDCNDANVAGNNRDAMRAALEAAQPYPVAAPQGLVGSANEWMATHAANARKAMLIAAEHAEVLYPDIDDRAWWHHEINALDKAIKDAPSPAEGEV